ncbi:hypothetical protein B0H14DRAFT_2921124 [Mycena olivaceomarginata]|nr:hypothetical protein B0H14DRAFT_2921124 [Mycena olivaceomarginata]
MSRRPFIPPFRPSHGHEDHIKHSATADRVFYTVGVGYTLGIYTDEFTARQQVNGYSNGKWKRSATYTEAVNTWDLMCAQYHQHEDDSPASSVAESPPPSPTLPLSPVVSPARAFRHSSLPPTSVAKTPSRTSAVARVVDPARNRSASRYLPLWPWPPIDCRPPIDHHRCPPRSRRASQQSQGPQR